MNFGWSNPWFSLYCAPTRLCNSLVLIGHYGCICMWLQPAIKQQISNLIGQQNLYSYTVMMHACGKLVMWLSRAVISLVRGSSSAQAQGFCPSSLDPWRWWGRGTRLHACILEIVKESGLLDHSIEQNIHTYGVLHTNSRHHSIWTPTIGERLYPALKRSRERALKDCYTGRSDSS